MVLQSVFSSGEVQISEDWDIIKIVGSKAQFEGVSEGDVIEYVPSWSEYKLSDLDREMYDKGFRFKRILVMKNNEDVELVNELMPVTLDTATPISEGKMRDDCGDLRFYWWNGDSQAWEEISYWIDNDTVNSGETKVILRIPKVDANGYVNIVAYYGAFHYGRKDDLSIAYGARAYEGKYLSFDGVDDYGRCGVFSGIGDTSFTIVTRVRLSKKPSVLTYVAGFYNPDKCVAVNDDGKIVFMITDSSNNIHNVVGNVNVCDGKWHWIAVVYDGANAAIYVDGVQDVSSNLGVSVNGFSGMFVVGDGIDSTYLAGDFEFVGYWATALTQTEITDLMSGKVPSGAVLLLDDSGINGDTWSDSSGNGRNVTLYGNPTVYKIGKVLDFDGVDDTVSGVLNADFSDGFSVVAIVKPARDDTQMGVFDIDTRIVLYMRQEPSARWGFFIVDENGVNTWITASQEDVLNKVIFVAGVWDGSTKKIYVDGELVSSVESAIEPYTPDDIFMIGYSGRISSGYQRYWEGHIYLIFVYNRALSDEEIQQIYENPNDPPRAGLVLWLAPDSVDDVNGKWLDKSGLGNDGTINGATPVEVRTFETTVQTSKVMSFDGVDDYVEISKIIDDWDEITIAMIVDVDSYNDNGWLCNDTSDVIKLILFWPDDQYGFDTILSDGSNYVRLQSGYTGTGIHMFVSRFDGSTLDGFVDGVLVKTVASPISKVNDVTGKMYIGSRAHVQYSNDKIYAVYIWNRALSDTEIQQLYNDPNNPPLDGLVLWLDGTSIDETNGKWLNKASILKSGYVELLDGVIYGATPSVLLSSAWSEEIDMNSGGLRITWRGKVVKKVESGNSTVLYVRVNNLGELINDAV